MGSLVKNILFASFILGIYWNGVESHSLDDSTVSTSRRNTEGQSCNGDNTRFQCASTADCISSDLECDGKVDCPDGSDENESLCKKYPCPRFLFRCVYGACIDSDARCDGKTDCKDNSDEINCEVNNTKTNDSKKCTTPAQPAHGKWVYLSNDGKGFANSTIDVNTVIKFSCEEGYKLSSTYDNSLLVICSPIGEWSIAEMPRCEKLCPSLYNTPLITLSCKNHGSVVPCDKASDNAILTYKCAPYYEPVHDSTRSSVCYDGDWDYYPHCIPVCGEKIISATPLIVNGHQVERGHYPWVVSLYSSRESDPFFSNICGATLITTEIVLTAAHCVTKSETGKIYPVTYFRVGAGKYYDQYDDPRDSDTAQYSEVALIETIREYRGEIQNFRGDIALLKLKTNLALSKVVQPVCFKNLPSLEENAVGVVTGWGYASDQPSDTLKELEVSYRSNEQCLGTLDEDFSDRFFTADKMCAETPSGNASWCRGDSGGGLVFKNSHYKGRYFIHGIFSLAQSTENQKYCSMKRSALFTKVETYIEWIQLKVRQWTSSNVDV